MFVQDVRWRIRRQSQGRMYTRTYSTTLTVGFFGSSISAQGHTWWRLFSTDNTWRVLSESLCSHSNVSNIHLIEYRFQASGCFTYYWASVALTYEIRSNLDSAHLLPRIYKDKKCPTKHKYSAYKKLGTSQLVYCAFFVSSEYNKKTWGVVNQYRYKNSIHNVFIRPLSLIHRPPAMERVHVFDFVLIPNERWILSTFGNAHMPRNPRNVAATEYPPGFTDVPRQGQCPKQGNHAHVGAKG